MDFSEEAGMAEMVWGENPWAKPKSESLLSATLSLGMAMTNERGDVAEREGSSGWLNNSSY